MSPCERRMAILEVLCIRRYDTYGNLANEFHVSKRTICRDISILMCSYPIETVRGRHGGGVRVAEGYYLHRRFLNMEQATLLIEIRENLKGHQLEILDSILVQFASLSIVP